METKLLAIICLMIFAGAAMVGPVSAVGSIANVTGNPVNYISIYETGDISNWPLTQDFLNVDTLSCTLNVTTNRIGWTVGVHDANTTKPQPGHMVEYIPDAYGTKFLFNAMVMDGIPLGGAYNAVPVTLNGASQVLWTGDSGLGGTGTWPAIPITIRQQVIHADESLVSPSVYRIVVTFTATNL